MKELTFILPIRIDSMIRLENLLGVLYFLKSTSAKIIIIEASKWNGCEVRKMIPRSRDLRFIHIDDNDPVFYRPHFINVALEEVETKIVSVWDADVLVDKRQLLASYEAILSEEYDFSFPYGGLFLNTDDAFREEYLRRHDVRLLLKYKHYFNYLYGRNFVGGGFLINSDKYRSAGGENEKFYGWGPEDLDRVQRWEAHGYKVHRSEGPMFHLCHPRDINGGPRTKLYQDLCFNQLNRSLYDTLQETIQYEDNHA